ncbi:MAG: zinc-binding dehydrogenase [Planctomycetota bacterium]
MSKILAAVMPEPGARVELREYDEPELEQDSALLRVEWSEVCGTDVHLHEGRLAGVPYPLIPGHVSVGRLERIRGRVPDLEGRSLEEGEFVTFLDVHRTCHACWYCLVAKASTRCPKRKVYGITYGVADGLAGGWAEKLYLKPGTRILPLGAVEPHTFMAGGCGLPTALHAVDRAEIAVGDTVLVLGAGPVGLSVLALARLRGASSVLLIGAPAKRLATAETLGASSTLDFRSFSEGERLDWVREHSSGRGADVTIEATGSPEAVVEAMRFTRDGGRVVVAGQYTDRGETSFNPHLDLNQKHLELRGSWGSDFSHFYRALRLLEQPESAALWSRIPLEEYALASTNEALAAVASGEVVKALIHTS